MRPDQPVVPYVGTWIEIIGSSDRICVITQGRSLRGNVDRNVTSISSAVATNRSFPTWERG